ncbi:uncharacterized protein B0H18DRAFT_1117948 [Fomitopsis serialis]|uniref:uncharacterized protein n=1 Tax=Fomitopsis serialis TaxID=139415 RepID=UPI002008A00A|nr:uncharacterized protein B0H18DRAFT_1117948 [Neoantrodia serialis]KAH9928261.1 hypothetical protein B0H18DRAFT_1117948 [Neoantrodia serialis]
MPDGSGSTYLHFAVRLDDVPFVYECIRLGADVNRRDVKGQTPLYCAMHELFGFSLELAERQLRHKGTEDESLAISTIARLRHIAKILVEQHADIKVPPHGDLLYHVVSLAWVTLEVELLELFGLYGVPSDYFEFLSEAPDPQLDTWEINPAGVSACRELAARFAATLPSRMEPITRPPRKCPCLSGKPLAECHGSGDHPYPPTFACICRSTKTYENCCKRRAELVERWDQERGCMAVTQRKMEGNTTTYISFTSVGTARNTVWPDTGKKTPSELVEMAVEYNDTQNEEKADPAFRYVVTELNYLPMPEGDWLGSKSLGKKLSLGWNLYVDQYIASGQDTRSVSQIERAAKLDPFWQPLWKRCEASGCKTIERPGLKMKRCHGCQKIYYCGAPCQKAHWKEHKDACKRQDHPLQMLRSQRIYSTILNEIIKPAQERLLQGSEPTKPADSEEPAI